MILKGFKFGMLLQFAIGPVCIFIFQTASLRGFYAAETGVIGVTLIDGFFITAAIFGIASIIDRKNIKIFMKIFSAVILFIFGLSTILGQFNINFLPGLNTQDIVKSGSIFINSIILTGSNPLTIIFWTGVFSAKISNDNVERKDIYLFGFGALLSTLSFLTVIALTGNLAKKFFSKGMIELSNITVGFLLIYFSIRMIMRKKGKNENL